MPLYIYSMTEIYRPITRCYYLSEWDLLPGKDIYELLARQSHSNLISLFVRVIRTDKTGEANPRIINIRRDGKEIGEVVFSGNICANRYYKDPEATKKLY